MPFARPSHGCANWRPPDVVYPDAVLARFDAPAHAGPLGSGPGELVTGRAGGVEDGIDVAFEARIDGGRIVAIGFRTWGCPYSVAASSLAAERLQGQAVQALGEFNPLELAPLLDLPPERRGRLLCIEDALRSCWRAWDNKGLSPSSVSRSDP